MSDLFPDAATVAPVETVSGSDETSVRRQRLSIAALVLGSLAIIGDLVIVVLGIITVTGSEPTTDAELLTSVLIVFGAIAAFWGGLVFAVLGTLFGIMALTRRQRRGPAVIGLVFSVITLVANVALGVQLLVDPAQLSNLGALLV